MTLKDCTKDELIFVIGQLKRQTGDYYVERALIEVADRRDQRKHEEEKRLFAFMTEKAQEIEQLYLPYNDDPYCEIPAGVVAKAKALAHEYDEATIKWHKLIGYAVKK